MVFVSQFYSRQTRRQFVKGAGMAGAAMLLGGAFPALGRVRAQVREVKIGHIHPLSGGLALEAAEMRDAIMLAAQEANDAGGIQSLGGARVTILHGNSEGSPEKGSSEAERLVREGALVLLGAYQSAVTFVTTQIAERRRTPFVVTVAVSDDILERGFKYTFRVQPNARTISRDAVDYLRQLSALSPIQRVALMYENSIFGTGISDHLVRFLDEEGFDVVGRIPYPTAAADVSSEVNRLRAMNADVGLFTGYFRDGVLVARTLRDLRVNLKAVVGVANGAFSHPNFAAEAGTEASENLMDVNYYFNPHGELTADVFRRYEQLSGRSMSTHALYAYMAAKVAIDAIERAGSTDREAIREALAATNYTEHILPQEAIRFDETGENINARSLLLQVRNGLSKVVLPDEYAEDTLVYPLP